MKVRYEDTCEIIREENGEKIVANVLAFADKKYVMVTFLNEKVMLRWNGESYTDMPDNVQYSTNGPLQLK